MFLKTMKMEKEHKIKKALLKDPQLLLRVASDHDTVVVINIIVINMDNCLLFHFLF